MRPGPHHRDAVENLLGADALTASGNDLADRATERVAWLLTRVEQLTGQRPDWWWRAEDAAWLAAWAVRVESER